ncbi:hypothetical protein AVEN_31532-1 [Araneus ventricosus]|uniref:Uncharacterized protein n=1 Tax=Araneus ventricosus TaxID=182803 RepID=A0A4Y2BW95_ARAVE|nr:hypothetical protein AVEN_31532-1 [Araneus ventricosus]
MGKGWKTLATLNYSSWLSGNVTFSDDLFKAIPFTADPPITKSWPANKNYRCLFFQSKQKKCNISYSQPVKSSGSYGNSVKGSKAKTSSS